MKLHELTENQAMVNISKLTDSNLTKIVTRMKKYIRNNEASDLEMAAQFSIDDFYDSGIVMTEDDFERLSKRLAVLFKKKHGTFKKHSPRT